MGGNGIENAGRVSDGRPGRSTLNAGRFGSEGSPGMGGSGIPNPGRVSDGNAQKLT